jgi:UDP-N-acetylglucosamine 2-epimerase (non-hydrolysing)
VILICFGTRPEWIKIKPVVDAIRGEIPYKLLFTGQHLDILDKVGEPVTTLQIFDGPNRLDSIIQSMMNREGIFDEITSVLVQGDTTSVFAMALAAFHRGIKIIHLEAGLRTYNKNHPYPEEFNRRSVSCMADIHFCPTQKAVDALQAENIKENVFLVGNTVLDNLSGIDANYGDEVIITLHRRENHHIMDEWFNTLNRIAMNYPEYKFTIPLHPNPAVQKHRHLLTHVNVVDPIPYDQFILKLANAKLVITDSGGIQEETSFFGKKCIVCREHTERSEGLNTFSFLTSPDKIEVLFHEIQKNPIPYGDCPYGDGMASYKILDILKGFYNV